MTNWPYPKTAHYIWIDFFHPYIPYWAKSNILQFEAQNPDWDIQVWRETDLAKIKDPDLLYLLDVNHYYLSANFANQAYTWARVIAMSDLYRLFILRRFGGMYMDTDLVFMDNMEATYVKIPSHAPNPSKDIWGVYSMYFVATYSNWFGWDDFLAFFVKRYENMLKRAIQRGIAAHTAQFSTWRLYFQRYRKHCLRKTNNVVIEAGGPKFNRIIRQKFLPEEKVAVHRYRYGVNQNNWYPQKYQCALTHQKEGE